MFDQASVESGAAGAESGVPTWLRLHGEMQCATRRRSAWDAQHARHLREAEALQLWNHFGYVSILEYLEREHGIDPRTALDRLRVSHALGELPLLEAELEEGAFAYSHVRELVRVMTPDTEERWIGAAKGKTVSQVQELVAGRAKGADPEDPTDPDLRRRRLSFEVTPQTLAMFRQAKAAIESELGHRLDEDDLLQIIFQRALEPGEGASAPVQISICAHCDRGWQDGAGIRAELDPADLDRARCDADHLGHVDAAEPARMRATITPRLRKQILNRDHHRCVVPGCRSARNLDLHHIEHQANGGGHQPSNLCTCCAGHHRQLHRGLLSIEGRAPDELRFTWRRADDDSSPVRAHVSTNPRHALRCRPLRSDGERGNAKEADPHTVPESSGPPPSSGGCAFDAAALRAQARDALVGLGWKRSIAAAAVDEARPSLGTDAGIDAWIREALRRCPKPIG
ncbi:MAG: hypothetical protein H0T42_14890 [Deltaproteobacteria bacterium]|nr:hypothetical protein [Deltaproteobacteria bacterium]